MAFPSVVLPIVETNSTVGNTKSVNLPATVDSGDKLLLIIATNGANLASLTPSSDLDDWQQVILSTLFGTNGNGSAPYAIYIKDADGTEGGTSVDFTLSGALISTAQVYRISGAEPGVQGAAWNFALNPADSAGQAFSPSIAVPTVTSPVSPTVEDNLFINGYLQGSNGPGSTTVFPTNYTPGVTTPSPLANSYWQAGAYRQLAAVSDSPSNYTAPDVNGNGESYRCWAIVFRPSQGIALAPAARANARARIEPTTDLIVADLPVVLAPAERANARALIKPFGIIPQAPRATRLEAAFMLNGIWTDAVPTGIYERDTIDVSYGRSNWAGRIDASRASMTLDNRDGRWSPDFDASANAGLWKRNIPVRVGVGGLFDSYLGRGFVSSKDVISTPDAAALDVADDVDLRWDLQLEEDLISEGEGARVTSKIGASSGFLVRMLMETGTPIAQFTWFDGAGIAHQSSTAVLGEDLPLQVMHDRFSIRMTMDASTGDFTWYLGQSIEGPWLQLGSSHNPTGPTSIQSNDVPLRLGAFPNDGNLNFPGKIFAFEMRDGIDGTVVASADFRNLEPGISGFTDSAGRVWTLGPGGRVTDIRWRFHGELASIPVRWNVHGSDVWAPIEAAGLFRRLRQGQRTLDSALRRSLGRSESLIQYWPCEEAGDTLTLFGAAVGLAPLVVTAGPPKTAANSDFIASKPIPTLALDTWTATVDDYSALDTTAWQLRWLQSIPDPGPTGAGVEIVRIVTTDATWVVTYFDTVNGQIVLSANRGGPDIFASAAINFNATGAAYRMTLSLTENGADSDVVFTGQEQDQPIAGGIAPTVSAVLPGRVTSIAFNTNGDATDVAIGHVTLQNARTSSTELTEELNANIGEAAGSRIQRLCLEEGLSFRIEGDPVDTEIMGGQRPLALIDLLQECANTDLGILHESRESIAIAYRTRRSLIGQFPKVELDYLNGEVAGPPQLDRDDQNFSNDVNVENATGASARAALEDGSDLSVSEPPVGAGRYDSSFRVNALDTRLVVLAQALLALSAVDEPRVSQLRLGPHFPALLNNPFLLEQILTSSLGDLFVIENNLPVALGNKDIRQLVQGTNDKIGNNTHIIDLLTTPALPWDDLNVADPIVPPPPPPPEPPPAGLGTPAPTIPAFNSGSAITVTSGQDLAAITAANPAGTHFFVENGAVVINVLAKANNHYRFAGNFVGVGTGQNYWIRPENIAATGVVIGSDPNAGSRARIFNYGNGTTNQRYGAVMGLVDDVLANQFFYVMTSDWFVYGLDFDSNGANAIIMGNNFTVYDCEIYKHKVAGIGGDRFVGGLVHSCHLWYNALDPATGVGSNGANLKVTWVNADTGRTDVTPNPDGTKAPFIVSNCIVDALDLSPVSPQAGNSLRGIWFDLDCQDVLVEYCEVNDHNNLGIFAEGCNNGRFTQNTVRRTPGFGTGLGANFINGALSVGESTNMEVDNNTIIDCTNAMVNRLSNRTSDWLNPAFAASGVGYAQAPRLWLNPSTTIPAPSGQSNIWTGDNDFHDNVLINCTRVVINEGSNAGGQTTQGATDLASITFSSNDYTASPSIMFYEASNTLLSLAAWQALPRTRDQ